MAPLRLESKKKVEGGGDHYMLSAENAEVS